MFATTVSFLLYSGDLACRRMALHLAHQKNLVLNVRQDRHGLVYATRNLFAIVYARKKPRGLSPADSINNDADEILGWVIRPVNVAVNVRYTVYPIFQHRQL